MTVGLLLLLISTIAHADQGTTGIGDVYPSIMRGVRPLGMGNAFITMPGTDSIAPYYTPAAINDYEEERVYSVGIPVIDMSPTVIPTYLDLWTLKGAIKSSMPTDQKIDLFRTYTNKYVGDFNTFYTYMPMFQVRSKYYALGLVGDLRTILSFRNVVFPNFDYKAEASAGVEGGSAYAFFDETLQIGGNLKLLFRAGREDEITTADIVVNTLDSLIGWQSWKKGFGAGVDLGMKYKAPFWRDSLRPTIGATVQDVGDTRFTGGAPRLPMSVSAGIGVFPHVGENEIGLLADIREMNHTMDFLNRVHLGAELRFAEYMRSRVSLRAGCNGGYPSGGFSIQFPRLTTFNFAFYGEEAGTYSHSKAVWHIATSLSWNWTM